MQKGALSENAVCNAVQLQTKGALRCARPQPDDHGQDFRVYQAGSPLSLALQVKAAYSHDAFGGYRFLLDLNDVPADARAFYVIAVLGTRELPGIDAPCWFIRGDEFRRVPRKGTHASFIVFPRTRRGSKWDAFRISRQDIGRRCLQALADTAAVYGVPLPAPHAKGISKILEGKVGEDAVTHLLIAGSDGRLAVFRPVADTIGQDLLVSDARGSVQLAAQVKTSFVAGPTSSIQVRVALNTFRPAPGRWVIVVPYIAALLKPAPILWAVPSEEYAALATERDGHLWFNASPGAGAAGKWTRYRCAQGNLAARFEGHLARARRDAIQS